jgi:D-beta-D-heptose 7-phosphate kinase/D-beta-D-heptose 1-phosphate adenosyltransferase
MTLDPEKTVRPHVLVVGDVMLDRYIIGHTHRISPEAPVPVVVAASEEMRAGGAANVERARLLIIRRTPWKCLM